MLPPQANKIEISVFAPAGSRSFVGTVTAGGADAVRQVVRGLAVEVDGWCRTQRDLHRAEAAAAGRAITTKWARRWWQPRPRWNGAWPWVPGDDGGEVTVWVTVDGEPFVGRATTDTPGWCIARALAESVSWQAVEWLDNGRPTREFPVDDLSAAEPAEDGALCRPGRFTEAVGG